MAKLKKTVDRIEIESHMSALCVKYGGALKPRQVLEEAKNQSSPIHGCFDWDDTVASRKWREKQARELIRSVRYVITTTTERFTIPNYVRNPKGERGDPTYLPVVTVAKDRDLARDVLVDQCNRARQAIETTRKQADFFGMSESFQQLIRELEAYEKRALQYGS